MLSAEFINLPLEHLKKRYFKILYIYFFTDVLANKFAIFQLPSVIAQLWCTSCPTHTVPRNHWRGTGMHQDRVELCCVNYQIAV